MENITAENTCILVRVAPDGMAETQFMSQFEDIRKKLKITTFGVQLGAIWKKPYNQYELNFDTIYDTENALTYLGSYFFAISIKINFPQNEMLPDVRLVRKVVNKD